MTIESIHSPGELIKFAKKHGLRSDWHEPDEQGITAKVIGSSLDNAGVGHELQVVLKKDGKPVLQVNLATLLSWACETKTTRRAPPPWWEVPWKSKSP